MLFFFSGLFLFCLFCFCLFVCILLKESDEVLHSQKKNQEKKLRFRPNEESKKQQKLEVAGGEAYGRTWLVWL